MAWVPYPGFCEQTYRNRSKNISIDRAINCYVQTNQIGTGKSGKSLVGRPGYQSFYTVSSSGRGLLAGDERLFAAVGSSLIELSSGGSPTTLGSIGSGGSPCTMFSNSLGTQLLIGNPDTGDTYVADGVTVTAVTTPADFWMWAFLDGKCYAVKENSNEVYSSAVNDFTTWDPLDKAISVATSDRIAQIYADHEMLVLFGRETTQFWYNTGQGGFSLQRVPNAFVETGIASSYSVVSIGGQLIALSDSVNGAGRIVSFRSGVATPVSTYAIEWLIRSVAGANLGEAIAWGMELDGHNFYVISWPSASLTLAYDLSEDSWSEWYGWASSAYNLLPWQFHANVFQNTHFVQNKANGSVYKLLPTLNTDLAVNFRRERVGPLLYSGKRTTFHRMRVDQLVGTSGSPVAPAASLAVSRDGGWNFGSYTSASVSANGETGVVEWRRLGQAGPMGFAASVVWDDGGDLACSGAMVDVTEDMA